MDDDIWSSMGEGSADYGSSLFDDFATGGVYGSDGSYTLEDIWSQMGEGGQQVIEAVQNEAPGFLDSVIKTLGNQAGDFLKKYLYNPDTKQVNLAGLATAAAALYGMAGGRDIQTGGWNQPVPKMEAVRERVAVDDMNRRPGSMGMRYFSDTKFVPEGGDVDAARAQAQEQAAGIAALQDQRQAAVQQREQQAPAQMNIPTPWAQTAEEKMRERGVAMAQGGQVPQFRGTLEEGGFVVPGDVVRHADPAGMARKEAGLATLNKTLGAEAIRGPGDAMSDSIPTTIEGKQPAAVANGEAYVPRDKVAQIGGGNVKRGADKLYDMMERLRLERTGSKKQINPDNPQELVRAYQGGQVKRFSDGGITSASTTQTAPQTTAQPISYGNSQYNTLAPWAGAYVTDALAKGAALANQPYQAYTGPLTAAPNVGQQQAFAGIQQIAQTGFRPETYMPQQQFTGNLAQQYMNPYIQAALEPQLQEMQRQANIARLEDAARLTKAGAYGGSRQAIMESEGRRNLMDMQRRAIGEGMLGGYERGLAQFNLEQQRKTEAQQLGEQSRRYSSEFGLKSLADLAAMGEQQRAIEQAGIEADRQQFEQEREWAYRMPQYQLGLLQGIPIGGTVTTPNMTGIASLQTQLADLGAVYDLIRKLG